MADLLNLGISGLLSAQRALSTTSHNIANVSTDGYSKQRVTFATRTPQYSGAGFVGQGVDIRDITRQTDDFVIGEIRGTTASMNQFDQFYRMAATIDSLIADPQGGLSPAMQGFFNSVNEVSNNPSSIPARQSMLTQAETMVNRFEFFRQRIDEEKNNVDDQIGQMTTQINDLARSIAELNRTIVDLHGNNGSQVANDLLDRRDSELQKLSELVSVRIVDQDNGTINVYVGTGQALVSGYDYRPMSSTPSEFDSGRLDVGVTVGSTVVNISPQMTGGKLAGLLDYRNRILDTVESALGRMAIGLTDHFNEQHKLGMDLNGQLGEDFFSVDGLSSPAILAAPNSNNAGTTSVSFLISDTAQLTASDYRLAYVGGNRFTLTRLSDSTVTTIDANSGYPYTAPEVDGITLTIDSAPTVRDSFLLRPAAAVLGSFGLAISDPAKIAAAAPIRTLTGNDNTGIATIDGGAVVDRATYVPDDYTIIMADQTAAAAGGTRGVITDNNTDSTLQYDLTINGVVVYSQTEAAAPLADLTALAAAINGASDANVALTGVRAYLNVAGTTLYLANDPPSSLPITVTESLTTSAGTVEDGDTVTGYFGGALTGVSNPTNSVTYSTAADSYIITDGTGAVVTSAAYSDGSTISFNGINVVIGGSANSGDIFSINQNLAGSADNRNALALAAVQTDRVLGGGNTSMQDAYGELVATIGTRTNQALVNYNAQDALLSHSLSAREAIAGVSLDEEAADLLRFQQLYQASAQVIVASNKVFESLLGVMR